LTGLSGRLFLNSFAEAQHKGTKRSVADVTDAAAGTIQFDNFYFAERSI